MVEFDPQAKEQPEQEEDSSQEEAVQAAQQQADGQPAVDVEAEDLKYPRPRGAFFFVMLLITFYVVYWTISYIEIFIIRGA